MKFIGNGWAVLPFATMLFVSGGVSAEPASSSDTTQTPAWAAPAKVYEQIPDSAAKPNEASAAPSATAAAPAPPPVTADANPVIDAIRAKLSDKAVLAKANADHVEALKSFYAARSEPLWIKDGAFTKKATAVIAEIKKADDYGLEASAFALPELASGASADAQGAAETMLGLAVLKYANYARGGRTDPVALSNILDMKPPLKDPKVVLAEITESADPAAYLRGQHPKHAQFEKLRQALARARGPQVEEKIDEALKIKLPDGKTIKAGEESDDIVLLRKRLKVEAQSATNERLFDAKLEAAVKVFQEANDLKANGQLNAKTRTALNKEGEPKKADPKRDVDRIIVNMERWRWLPEDLGPFYVMNNIPEFVSRVIKGESEVLKQKIIVGQPTWPTPVLTASMEFVIFHPEWGVPDGIKVKELLPRLKRASAQYGYGGGFFDQLFNGGQPSGGGARVLAAYKLNPTINGRPVDANTVDWNRVDIRQFSFVQPAGAENPLGLVKFRFPNRHDVYMHDTPQKGLFSENFRALSHGCMRLDQPRKLAEVILGEDKGWTSDKVGGLYAGTSNEIALTKPVPVYLTYFTVRIGDDGRLEKFADIYGHDEKLVAALQGRSVHYDSPNHADEMAGADDGGDASPLPPSSKKSANKQVYVKEKRNKESSGNLVSDALSGLLGN
jgi:murein L,D-transpeptidase YcbB/YkuD